MPLFILAFCSDRSDMRAGRGGGLLAAIICVLTAGCGDSSPAAPTPVIPTVQGTWTGEYTVSICNDQAAPGFCTGFAPVGSALPMRLVLSQTGQQLSGTIELGAFSIPASGTVSASGRMALSGSVTLPLPELQSTVTIVNWDTVVVGTSMTGGWRTTFVVSGFPGSPFFDSTIRLLTKTA